ncbi:metallophosphoesterase [Micrococcus sp. EYE_162]|uniref:metallophosphoesterase n=1 Tax=unclassified Micrococcus TaxID=2620948 RepID=UPI002004860A|nr:MULTISPECIES: metallophosphoesterase [unclassified Micrococcus]MCK6095078.1 metallophosphoesterase [Micrococcus sp. EYE_212]MCK6171025.1 metallophosphoesterase [Micrococcus sp. EYE_162]
MACRDHSGRVDAPATTDSSLAAPADRISFSVLPDTQFYSRYATAGTGDPYMTHYGSEPFLARTQWIADNDQAYDVAFTMHLGDVVDRANPPEEWAVADEAMSVLEQAGAPYSVLAGNHDVGAGASDTDAVSYETYVSHFSAEPAAQQSTFLERDPSGASEAHLVAQDGTTFLVLAISWQSQQETLDWANRVIAAHPGVPTILTSHQILNVDEATGEQLSSAYGERLWNDVIAPNDQVFLTLNGHHHGATEQVCFDDAGRTGNTASYFTTADGADVNDETFPNGFTLEAFIKIDPDFTPEENAWMRWLTRDGQRENLPGYVETEGDEPPFAWAFSNLRDVQLSVVDSQAPVATETVGIAHDEAQRWVFGAGSYDGQRQSGFLGCLGETRMVDRPLAQNQGLTSRAETTTPVDPAPVEPTPVAHPERMLTRGDAVALVRDRTGVDLTGILADQRGGRRGARTPALTVTPPGRPAEGPRILGESRRAT